MDDPAITLAPNPGSGVFVLTWPEAFGPVDVEVFSSVGQSVLSVHDLPSGSELDLQGLSDGMYVVHILRDEGVSYKRLILQR